MKAVITGPRRGLTSKLELPYLHLEVEYEDLPKVGETIIVNSGSSYTVKNIMWWVQGPENEDYWHFDGDYNAEARHEIVHIDVEPADMKGHDLYGEGKAAGRREAARDLARIVEIARKAGDTTVSAMTQGWLREQLGEEQA
jgi:hypothetical protein